MKNNFTREEIKNSLEYRWRKDSVRDFLLIWVIMAVLSLVVMLIFGIKDLGFIFVGLQIWLIVMALYGVFLLPFLAFYCYKMHDLLKRYEHLPSYEVVLDSVSTSYMYRGAVYYTVTICDQGITRRVRTNPLFSSKVSSMFTLEEFNNKTVVGLYDSDKDVFYIVRRVG